MRSKPQLLRYLARLSSAFSDPGLPPVRLRRARFPESAGLPRSPAGEPAEGEALPRTTQRWHGLNEVDGVVMRCQTPSGEHAQRLSSAATLIAEGLLRQAPTPRLVLTRELVSAVRAGGDIKGNRRKPFDGRADGVNTNSALWNFR